VLACEQCGHGWTREDRRTTAERRRQVQPVARERRETARRRYLPGGETATAGDRSSTSATGASLADASGGGVTLGPSIQVNGTISAGEDVLLNGRIEGKIAVPGHTVTIGEAAQVAASIDARNVIVWGALRGNITATGRIVLKPGAQVEGDLVSRVLGISDGALFQGRVRRPQEQERV
jgi:cytoskeletal protein CcmA (bactofilin family)